MSTLFANIGIKRNFIKWFDFLYFQLNLIIYHLGDH